MNVAIIYIPGTQAPPTTSFFRYFFSLDATTRKPKLYPEEILTTETHTLIPVKDIKGTRTYLHDIKARLVKSNDKNIKNADFFYFRHPGLLSNDDREQSAKWLNKSKTLKQYQFIIIYAHSHGGTIARKYIKMKYRQGEKTCFAFISAGMPMLKTTWHLMPPSVLMWHCYYHESDKTQYSGSFLRLSDHNIIRHIGEIELSQKPSLWTAHTKASTAINSHKDTIKFAAEDAAKQLKIIEPLIATNSQEDTGATATGTSATMLPWQIEHAPYTTWYETNCLKFGESRPAPETSPEQTSTLSGSTRLILRIPLFPIM